MSNRLITPEARQRLKAQQAEEAKAVSAHAGACARLASAQAKRAEVISAQDELVAGAERDVAVAAAAVVVVSGLARAAAILDMRPASLRRLLTFARSPERARQ